MTAGAYFRLLLIGYSWRALTMVILANTRALESYGCVPVRFIGKINDGSHATLIRMHVSRRWFAAIFAAAAWAIPTLAQPSPEALSPAVVARLDSLVTSEMSRAKIPGLSLAIVTDQAVRLEKGYGMSDLENSVPAKANTSYRLASITKSITATAVMQLVEAGKLD